jgi:hypothetical protein
VDAPIDHVAEKVDDLGAHTGVAGRERVRPKQEDRPHDINRERRPNADRVAAHEVALELAQLVVRDAHRGKIAESCVDAVDRIVGSGDLGDDLGGLLDLALRRAIEPYRDVATGDRDDVRDGQVVAGEPEGGYFRFSRYQAPSAV